MAAQVLTGHTLLAGPNGTGKTTVARQLVQGVRGLAVCDTKGVGDFQGVGHDTGDVQDVLRYDRVVYHARPGAEGKELEPFFEACFQRGHLVVLVDEIMHACSAGYMGRWLRALLRSGRGRKIKQISLAQSLVGLHNDVLRESWFYLLFSLAGTDEAKMLEWGIPPAVAAQVLALRKHEYIIWDREERRAHGPQDTLAGTGGTGGQPARPQKPPAQPLPAGGRNAPRRRRAKPGGARGAATKKA